MILFSPKCAKWLCMKHLSVVLLIKINLHCCQWSGFAKLWLACAELAVVHFFCKYADSPSLIRRLWFINMQLKWTLRQGQLLDYSQCYYWIAGYYKQVVINTGVVIYGFEYTQKLLKRSNALFLEINLKLVFQSTRILVSKILSKINLTIISI